MLIPCPGLPGGQALGQSTSLLQGPRNDFRDSASTRTHILKYCDKRRFSKGTLPGIKLLLPCYYVKNSGKILAEKISKDFMHSKLLSALPFAVEAQHVIH
jgi:hypothetical protein